MTSAKEKIESLTRSWYGLIVFSAVYGIAKSGLGLFTIFFTGFWTVAMLALAWFLGNRLANRSSLTRIVLVILSALGTLFGGYAVLKMGWMFLHEWSFTLLVDAFFTGGYVMLQARSFNTLTDDAVKAHCRG